MLRRIRMATNDWSRSSTIAGDGQDPDDPPGSPRARASARPYRGRAHVSPRRPSDSKAGGIAAAHAMQELLFMAQAISALRRLRCDVAAAARTKAIARRAARNEAAA